jgi:hypothetical protein
VKVIKAGVWLLKKTALFLIIAFVFLVVAVK